MRVKTTGAKIEEQIQQLDLPSRNKNFDYFRTREGQALHKSVKLIRGILRDVLLHDDYQVQILPSAVEAEVVVEIRSNRYSYFHQLKLTKTEFQLLEKIPELRDIFSKLL